MTEQKLQILETKFAGVLEEIRDSVMEVAQEIEDAKVKILTEGIQNVGNDTA